MEKFGQKMLKAYSYSKSEFVAKMKKEEITDKTVEDTNDYYICIDPTGGPNSEPYFEKIHPNVLNICFDDVAEDVTHWGDDIKAYYKAVAPTLVQITCIKSFLNNAVGTVHVHCMKGESRSKAVVDYVNNSWTDNDGKYAYGIIRNTLDEL